MKRVFVVYNPRASRHNEVKAEVLDKLHNYRGLIVGKYEVEDTDVDDNAMKLAKIIDDGDTVIAAGGDATASIVVNGAMRSGKKVRVAALPYGNFNDFARTINKRGLDDILGSDGKEKELYPLEIIVDGKLFRYAACYVTIGMMAEATELFDNPKVRKKLGGSFGRKVGSYLSLAKWYFGNRKKQFIPSFSLNGEAQSEKATDYVAVNGKSVARIMKGGEDYDNPRRFRSGVMRLGGVLKLCRFMMKSIVIRVPGEETVGDTIEFATPSKVEIQAEGEYKVFDGVRRIEIRKSERPLEY